MKKPFSQDRAFMADVQGVIDRGGTTLWWLGQSGFLLARNGRALVMDPYLSDSLTRKYANTDKPHVRITEPVVDPTALGALGVIDTVTSSHNHTDHFDPETLLPILKANPHARLVVPAANRVQALERLGPAAAGCLLELDDNLSVEVSGLEIRGVAAAHNTVDKDDSGRCCFLGYVVKWGELTVYHSGDTLWHEGLVPALRPLAVDIALLPINGNVPERRVAGNLDGPQAAQLAHAIDVRLVIPCHFDLFEFNTASPDGFVAECERLGQGYRVLRHGEGWEL